MERHNASQTKLYRVWASMKQRCYNPKNPGYRWWGEKGIGVCEEWRESFATFRDWAMSSGYSEDTPNISLDRVDEEKGYSPDNCQWISRGENSRKSVVKREKWTIEQVEWEINFAHRLAEEEKEKGNFQKASKYDDLEQQYTHIKQYMQSRIDKGKWPT